MWATFNLRSRIYVVLAALVGVSLFGGLVMIWYTYRMDAILLQITEKEFTGFQTTEALETALVNQKGFVSYYFLDGDPEWLRQLGEYRQVFAHKLKEAQALASDQIQKEALDRIALEYSQYITVKDQVIGHYKAGRRSEGAVLHEQARKSFFKILELCEAYKRFHVKRIQKEADHSRQRAQNLRVIAVAAVLTSLVLAVLLAVIFVRQILDPVSQLLRDAGESVNSRKSQNVVNLLSRTVHGLIADADQTHSELKKSQETLAQAEKMAMVGKLAAGMAHSIRNPFTSVKMRLFSLNRSLALSPDQQEDFDVISNEIKHIDTIVQNFLEFSRPPKLKIQKISLSAVVDRAIQLLSHRLRSYDVKVTVQRHRRLPAINGDPEQLKEVLVNLMINACEAIGNGGEIIIREEVITKADMPTILVSVSDSGPGIPTSLQGKVLQPFFTTKEEGTGLGLSIVARIVEEHTGELAVESDPGNGATFRITFPIEETDGEYDPDNR